MSDYLGMTLFNHFPFGPLTIVMQPIKKNVNLIFNTKLHDSYNIVSLNKYHTKQIELMMQMEQFLPLSLLGRYFIESWSKKSKLNNNFEARIYPQNFIKGIHKDLSFMKKNINII